MFILWSNIYHVMCFCFSMKYFYEKIGKLVTINFLLPPSSSYTNMNIASEFIFIYFLSFSLTWQRINALLCPIARAAVVAAAAAAAKGSKEQEREKESVWFYHRSLYVACAGRKNKFFPGKRSKNVARLLCWQCHSLSLPYKLNEFNPIKFNVTCNKKKE